ncbi:MAG: carotenoid biosynthesis protein [Minisyncoccia bacterium]|jgi:putative membrane protein
MMFLEIKEKITLLFIALFYITGAFFLTSNSLNFRFFEYSSFIILLNFLIVIIFQKNKFNKKFLLFFILFYLFFFFIEVLGVKTGKIFGSYFYGESLGFKIFETPVLIGLNWIFLIYLTFAFSELFKISDKFKIILGSLLMLFYDFILEKVAPLMGLWFWEGNSAPFLNYFSWFILALISHSILRFFKFEIKNIFAVFVYFLHIIFYIIILFRI